MASCLQEIFYSSKRRGRIVMYASDGTDVSLAFKLEFLFPNNEAKYKGVIIWLISALQMRIQTLCMQEIQGSLLPKLMGSLHLKETTLVAINLQPKS